MAEFYGTDFEIFIHVGKILYVFLLPIVYFDPATDGTIDVVGSLE